jgi:hypothetical protein
LNDHGSGFVIATCHVNNVGKWLSASRRDKLIPEVILVASAFVSSTASMNALAGIVNGFEARSSTLAPSFNHLGVRRRIQFKAPASPAEALQNFDNGFVISSVIHRALLHVDVSEMTGTSSLTVGPKTKIRVLVTASFASVTTILSQPPAHALII